MSENTDDFEIDLGELPEASDEVEIDLGPLTGEATSPEEVKLAEETPEPDEVQQPEADDVATRAVAKLREELESKWGE